MRPGLERVLRIRALLEELSRLELEKKAGEMLRLEKGAERLLRRSLEVRADACEALSGEAAADRWLTDIADAEILTWNSRRLRALAEARQPAVEQARQVLLARRLERRQVATLLESAAEAEKRQQGRREQNRLDEWFRIRAGRRPGQ